MKNRIAALAALLALALTGCASGPSWSDLAHYPGTLIGQARHEVMVERIAPNCVSTAGIVTPAHVVFKWMRENDAAETIVVCDAKCNCKIVKGAQPALAKGSEICQ